MMMISTIRISTIAIGKMMKINLNLRYSKVAGLQVKSRIIMMKRKWMTMKMI